ncbi:glycoside hydrolase family 2 protein [Candidatus Latescibacterota bacterium]
MKKLSYAVLAAAICGTLIASYVQAAPGRWETELSGDGWRLWLDREADWIDDDIFLPPVDISRLPVNPPTCGWDNIDAVKSKAVSVPGTVEEYCWSANGNLVGRAGDYRGVSWWSTTFTLDPSKRGKKIVLAFESVNLRAEVFVNRKLVGYDVIGNTQFEVDATDAVRFSSHNRLDIRITDAGGNFSWPAHTIFKWGKNMIPIVRGFGGITGKVTLLAQDQVHVDDIFVENKPSIKNADVHVTLGNDTGSGVSGELTLEIVEYNSADKVIWKKTMPVTVPSAGTDFTFKVKAPKAEVWGLLDPHLYTARVSFRNATGTMADSMGRRFGFRWFEIGEKDGDQRLYLNGKRVFMMATVNRGYWQTNGIYSTPEMARKDVEISLELGYNSIAFHNAIGQPLLLQYADEYGMLCTGESGGYRINDDKRIPWPDETTRALRREKLFRFVKRDRSSPSLIAYMLKNEDSTPPDDDDYSNMAKVRELDPTRTLLYTGDCDRVRPAFDKMEKHPLKLFYKPNDDTEYWYGWFDKHHWHPRGGYTDEDYSNPRNYIRLNIEDADSTRQVPKDEIIFYGEEGAFGTMVRLGKIREQLYRQDSANGWRETEHIDWYNAYDRFLDETGFRSSYPTVDHLTLALGKNMHYFHGRIIENARISNVIDAYNLNGWASAATHSDIADAYRFPTGNPSILKYYNQPLYVAVKIRDKVVPMGYSSTADIFIVNELNLKGKRTLNLELTGPDGNTVFTNTYQVTIKGGEEFGQLLVEGVTLPPTARNGYYRLDASITGRKGVDCKGSDEIYSVDYMNGPGLTGKGAVVDASGVVRSFIQTARGVNLPDFTVDSPQMDYIIIGKHDFGSLRRTMYKPIMEQVANGATLIVLDGVEKWAEQWDNLLEYQAVQYYGSKTTGNRGRLFVGRSTLLEGLPLAQSMNWEYQVFYRANVKGISLNPVGHETVVAIAPQNRKDILTAVARIPFANGRIIASTLNIMDEISSDRPQSSVAKKLVLNFIEFAKE